jgi:hypothetical protein
LISVEPEIVKCSEANRIRVLILRKGLAVPGDRGRVLGNGPRHVAISGVSYRAIVGEARMLRWRMEPDVTNINSSSNRHSKRLDPAIEVLVIERVLIMPDAGIRSGHFVTHEPDTIAAWGRLNLIHGRAGPSRDGRVLSYGRASSAKVEIRRATTHGMLTVRSVVKHIALGGMTLTPDAFVRDDVVGFSKIGSALILRRDQVSGLHQNAVRRGVMNVAAMIVRCTT